MVYRVKQKNLQKALAQARLWVVHKNRMEDRKKIWTVRKFLIWLFRNTTNLSYQELGLIFNVSRQRLHQEYFQFKKLSPQYVIDCVSQHIPILNQFLEQYAKKSPPNAQKCP